jgi:hypothetical protein
MDADPIEQNHTEPLIRIGRLQIRVIVPFPQRRGLERNGKAWL